MSWTTFLAKLSIVVSANHITMFRQQTAKIVKKQTLHHLQEGKVRIKVKI
jgi:hypothetical protein